MEMIINSDLTYDIENKFPLLSSYLNYCNEIELKDIVLLTMIKYLKLKNQNNSKETKSIYSVFKENNNTFNFCEVLE